MIKKYELIIFDLDGTLLDTSKGIFNSVRYTEKQLHLNHIEDYLLKEFVGPPPKLMYMKYYGLSENEALIAVEKHREYGRTKGIYEAKQYAGITETLINLKKNGYKLAVATLKSQDIAEKILKNFNLKEYFNCIFGMDCKETLTKSMIIRNAIKECKCVDTLTVMVGDTQSDFLGASETGIDFVGVKYGFGFRNNSEFYKFPIIDYPIDLLKLL